MPEEKSELRFNLTDAIYYPFKQLPETKLATYAVACLEVALNYSEPARAAYLRVIQSWELPGCQTLINEYVRCKSDTRDYLNSQARAVVRGKSQPSYPDSWNKVVARAENNADFQQLLRYVTIFILVAFNRQSDIADSKPKVVPARSSNLVQVIVRCSLMDYLVENNLSGPRVILDDELAEFYWFLQILAGNPNRQARRKISKILRSKGFELKHFSKILNDAKRWYKSRVNPGTVEEYLDKLAKEDIHADLDRGNLENAIAPYDEAMGYPRKWRRRK